jgi:hypothetical protein
MRYEIDAAHAVRIFDDGQTVAFWFQPNYPNSDTFDSNDEARAWAELAIASFQADQPYPPNGKGIAGQVKPTA